MGPVSSRAPDYNQMLFDNYEQRLQEQREAQEAAAAQQARQYQEMLAQMREDSKRRDEDQTQMWNSLQAAMSNASGEEKKQFEKQLEDQRKAAQVERDRNAARYKDLEEKAKADERKSAEKLDSLAKRMKDQDEKHAKVMEDAMRKAEANIQKVQKEHQHHLSQLTTKAKLLEAELEKDKQVYSKDNPELFNQKMADNFSRFLEAAAKHLPDVPKLEKRSVAVLGPSGTGKSTIINGLCGRVVTATDIVECTDNISLVHSGGDWDYYDVPGSHDNRNDWYNTENLLKLKSLHLVLVVYTQRVQHVSMGTKLMTTLGVPVILVRNMCDFEGIPQAKWEEARRKEMDGLKKDTGSEFPIVFVGHRSASASGSLPGIEALSKLMLQLKDDVMQPQSASKRRKIEG